MRLGLLSTFTPVMLEASLRRSGPADMFEHVLSTDRAPFGVPARLRGNVFHRGMWMGRVDVS